MVIGMSISEVRARVDQATSSQTKFAGVCEAKVCPCLSLYDATIHRNYPKWQNLSKIQTSVVRTMRHRCATHKAESMSFKNLFKSKPTTPSTPLSTLESHFDTSNAAGADPNEIEAAVQEDLQDDESKDGDLQDVLETKGRVEPTFQQVKLGVVIPTFHMETESTQASPSVNESENHSWWHRFKSYLAPAKSKAHYVKPAKPKPTLGQTKRVVIIGTHGWFPRPSILKIIGQPTGTSSKFADMTNTTLVSMLSSHGITDSDIVMFALQHQGRVEERVDVLFQHLADHRPVFQAADLVLFAAHSQGVVVTTHIISQMLDHGILDADRQRVGFLAIAGIAHGPFPHLRGNPVIKYFEKDAARELFDYCMEPVASNASWRFEQALRNVLEKGVRMTAVGGWKDQVVGLYSSLLTRYSSPNLHRCIFIANDEYHSDDFLVRLTEWCVTRRNKGLYDDGLLIHLSEAISGDLLAGRGHSTLYEEGEIYKIAIEWTFAPAKAGEFATHEMHNVKDGKITTPNPYTLPWIMARMLYQDEDLKRIALDFARWMPIGQRAKEIRYRLEPLLLLNKL